jgi:hypothetical protein
MEVTVLSLRPSLLRVLFGNRNHKEICEKLGFVDHCVITPDYPSAISRCVSVNSNSIDRTCELLEVQESGFKPGLFTDTRSIDTRDCLRCCLASGPLYQICSGCEKLLYLRMLDFSLEDVEVESSQ